MTEYQKSTFSAWYAHALHLLAEQEGRKRAEIEGRKRAVTDDDLARLRKWVEQEVRKRAESRIGVDTRRF